jgi:hypothetical protein
MSASQDNVSSFVHTYSTFTFKVKDASSLKRVKSLNTFLAFWDVQMYQKKAHLSSPEVVR